MCTRKHYTSVKSQPTKVHAFDGLTADMLLEVCGGGGAAAIAAVTVVKPQLWRRPTTE